MAQRNDYPEPEEMETVSLDEILEEGSVHIEEEEDPYLEPDDGEELNFNDQHRGWR